MTRGRPPEFDRGQALEAAMEQFWERGFEATGLSDLEARTGLGRQSLYNAFGDKRAIFLACLEHYRQSYLAPMVELLRAPGSALDNIRAVLDLWEKNGRANASRGCLLANSLAEFGARDGELDPTLKSSLSQLERAFENAVKRAQKEGELSRSHKPKELARLLTTVAQGLSAVNKVQGGAFSRDALRAVRSLLA